MLISDYREREKRRESKRQRALSFIASETWTTPAVLKEHLGCSRSAIYKLLTQLRRDGMIRDHSVSDLRLKIIGATPHCVAVAASSCGLSPSLLPLQPSKIKPVSVAHKLDLQIARVRAEALGWTEWQLARELPKGWGKYPDAVAQSTDNNTIAIELERTLKSRRRYRSILSAHLQSVASGRYSAVHYVCPNPIIASALSRMFRSITRVPVAGKRVALNDRHRARLPVFDLDKWPPLA